MSDSNSSEARIGAGSVLAALGAVLLLVSLFCIWYSTPGDGGGASGWQSFELVDILLALIALGVIFALFAPLVGPGRRLAVPPALVAAAGPAALVLVVVNLIDEPPLLLVAPDAGPAVGIWLALVGALLICAGSLLGRHRISLVIAPRDRRPGDEDAADPAAETRAMPSEHRSD